MIVINFYHVNDAYGCFSNFSEHPVLMDGVLWPTSEHYFQAQKFKDPKIKKMILTAKTPLEAARLGRKRDFPLRKGWDGMKDAVMLDVVRAKVLQHKEISELLLSTGNAVLVEHTENDSYWGDGDGSGKNRLGKILMKIREELGM